MRNLLTLLVLLSLAGAAHAADFAWWKDELPYRVPVVVKTAGVEESDAPAQVRFNFSAFLPGGEQLDLHSVRVVEQDAESGAFLREYPALVQPVDNYFSGLAPLNFQKPYDPAKPPWIRASSENPANPALNLVQQSGLWEAGTPTPPWTLAIDLGEAKLINTALVLLGYDGGGRVLAKARLETATESADGLTDGNWELVGDWDQTSMFENGSWRPFCFAPRKARYVRLVMEKMTGGVQPKVRAFQIFRPLYDPDNRQEARISWYVPGTWNGERSFFLYFDALRGQGQPAPPMPEQVAILREAEETLPVRSPAGVAFSPTYDKTASGPTDPNLLSYQYKDDAFIVPTAWAVTLPREGLYTLAMRIRGNPGDHQIAVLWDRKILFQGVFGLEGEDWNMIGLQPQTLTAGVHTLELMIKKGNGPRPVDLDLIMLTTAPEFLPNQVLLAYPGAGEVRR